MNFIISDKFIATHNPHKLGSVGPIVSIIIIFITPTKSNVIRCNFVARYTNYLAASVGMEYTQIMLALVS